MIIDKKQELSGEIVAGDIIKQVELIQLHSEGNLYRIAVRRYEHDLLGYVLRKVEIVDTYEKAKKAFLARIDQLNTK